MSNTHKPIASVHQALVFVWLSWLLYRLVIHVMILGATTQANMFYGVLWQILVLLPALAFTPTIMQAKSAYRLILASLLMLIYLAGVGVFFAIRLYENAPFWIKMGLGMEVLFLLLINVMLMALIKRLPPMYKNNKERS